MKSCAILTLTALVASTDALNIQKTPPALRGKSVQPLQKALDLRGGSSLGPLTPEILTYVQAAMGLLYAVEMFGLRPDTPDPVAKYWGKSGDDGSNAIMQWLGMSIVWCNGLVLYALTSLS